MTTQSWNTPITHSTDAQFRAWGSEIDARLALIGLVQTADTGQINWATVTRPAINTMAGYSNWRFNDTLQGTAPIFFKLEFGTGAVATAPATFITVGTGTNGAGTITGQATDRSVCCANTGATNAITNWPSFACAVDGCAWIANKYNAPAAGVGFTGFQICRSVDATGTPTATGFVLYTRPSASTIGSICAAQAVRTATTSQTFTATGSSGLFSFIVHGVSTSVDGANTQAYEHWMPMPKVIPVFGVCTMISTEAIFGVADTFTLVGTTPRTYVSVGTCLGQGGPQISNQSLLMIYE